MKIRVISIAAALLLTVSLCACQSGASSESSDAPLSSSGSLSSESSSSAPSAQEPEEPSGPQPTTLVDLTGVQIQVINSLGFPVTEVYLSPTHSEDWLENLLPEGITVQNGYALPVELPGGVQNRYWDLRVVGEDGKPYEWHALDMATLEKVTVSLTDGQPTASLVEHDAPNPLTIRNGLSVKLKELYISAAETEYWEQYLMQGELAPGDEIQVVFRASESAQFWDLRAVDENGEILHFMGLDLFDIHRVELALQDGQYTAVVN